MRETANLAQCWGLFHMSPEPTGAFEQLTMELQEVCFHLLQIIQLFNVAGQEGNESRPRPSILQFQIKKLQEE